MDITHLREAPAWFWEVLIIPVIIISWRVLRWLFNFFLDAREKELLNIQSSLSDLKKNISCLDNKLDDYSNKTGIAENDIRHLLDAVRSMDARLGSLEAAMARMAAK